MPLLRRSAPQLALSAIGCALVLVALQLPPAAVSPSPTPAVPFPGRTEGVAVSARGYLARRASLPSPEEAPPGGEPSPEAGEAPLLLEEPEEPPPTPTEEPAPTPIPPRTEVIVYQAQPGDNLWLIAQHFGLDMDTIVWANPEVEKHPNQLRIGQELSILPIDGVLHTVKAGETLAGIAQRYRADVQRIVDYPANGIGNPSAIQPGQMLIVPGGVRPPEPRPAARASSATTSGGRLRIPAGAPAVPTEAPAQPGRFVWPAKGVLTQGYHRWHGAIDVANRQGTPLLAADAGTITFAAWSGGLGNAIQIDHGDGFATTYAHLHTIQVQVGQAVERGQQIGLMGTTGNSTGPHLHFIVTYNGGILNPMDYLP